MMKSGGSNARHEDARCDLTGARAAPTIWGLQISTKAIMGHLRCQFGWMSCRGSSVLWRMHVHDDFLVLRRKRSDTSCDGRRVQASCLRNHKHHTRRIHTVTTKHLSDLLYRIGSESRSDTSLIVSTMDPNPPLADEPQPSIFRWILGFLMVGACWGLTTPFMRRAAMYT
jgi:hypothetical protein